MQLHISGRLVRDPAQKTSASGKAYVNAMMVATSTDGEQLIRGSTKVPVKNGNLASFRPCSSGTILFTERAFCLELVPG